MLFSEIVLDARHDARALIRGTIVAYPDPRSAGHAPLRKRGTLRPRELSSSRSSAILTVGRATKMRARCWSCPVGVPGESIHSMLKVIGMGC